MFRPLGVDPKFHFPWKCWVKFCQLRDSSAWQKHSINYNLRTDKTTNCRSGSAANKSKKGIARLERVLKHQNWKASLSPKKAKKHTWIKLLLCRFLLTVPISFWPLLRLQPFGESLSLWSPLPLPASTFNFLGPHILLFHLLSMYYWC